MPQTTTPAYIRKKLEDAGFNELSVNKLMNVNPELALVACKAKQLYESTHPGKSFQVEQGFRSKIQQQHIAALGSNFTGASGKKGHESPHQFGQAIDFHILEKNAKGEWVPQDNKHEISSDYVDVANCMKQAAQQLGLASKFNYGALGDVHVGKGKKRHNDWGHIEEKKQFWNQWHPGQGMPIPGTAAKPPQQQQCIPCVQPPQKPPKPPSLLDMFIQPLQQFPFKLRGPG